MATLLSFDPGAERCGWAVLGTRPVEVVPTYWESHPVLVASGVLGLSRGNRDFQHYRMAVEVYFHREIHALIVKHEPDRIINEIVPPVGSGNFVGPQSYLANIVATIIHTSAFRQGVDVEQISARSVQKQIALRGKSKKITKVQVRNGVINLFPDHKAELMQMKPDQTDAIAIGLAALGFSNLQ